MGRKAAGLEVWKKLKEKNPWLAEKWEKWFQRDNLLILVLSGVLLMTLALPTESKKGQDNASVKQGQSGTANGTSGSLRQNAGDGNTKDRENCREEAEAFLWNGTDTAALEKRLAGILGQVSGAGEGEGVLGAGDGEEALDIFYQQKDIALLVLDIMMPRINGLEVCREIRQTSKVPIIMLTAKGDERDELNGFDIGADEYISKPFSPKILVARVNALLRRANKLGKEAVISEAGGIVMDKTAHTVAIDGRDIELSVKEFELLDYFMSNQGIALTRERILDSVWSYDYFGDARTIDTHVKKLRSKMGAKGDYIKTVWGVGYKFEIQ